MKRLFFFTILLSLPCWHFAQDVAVTFKVNMNYQIELGNFDPSNANIDLAGTFNGWNGTPLSDTDNDNLFEVTLTGFAVGENIEFKFRKNGSWDGTEEFPGGGPNRVYTVKANNEIVVWYNDEVSPDGPPLANLSASDQTIYSGGIITFNDASSGSISNRTWQFEGGFPTTATTPSANIKYATAGSYDVSIIVQNDNDADTLLLEDYITVQERAAEDLAWWNETVFYEIFVRSFYDTDGNGIGDFKGLTEKLDYLNDGDPNTTDDLGIEGIWLMPIHASPSYHGYDVTDYRSINPEYGTMEDFKDFLAAAHERGIKVIIDYVMNHSSDQHPWFQNAKSSQNSEKRNWYRWEENNPNYNGPWGQQVWHQSSSGYYYGLFWGGMPDLNYEEPAVKEEMFDIADFWLKEIGIDGFRLDAVKYIVEEGNALEDTDATFQFFRDFNAHYKAIQPEAFTVGEAWTNTSTILKYVEDEGIDYCFEFDLSYSIIDALNNSDANRVGNQLQRIYNVYPNQQFGTFLTNHDQDRILDVFGGNIPKLKAAAGIYLTAPGIPYIYYGEEIGMRGRKPDENIRRPMQWSDDANAGFTDGRPWRTPNSNYVTFNVEEQGVDENSILSWYRQLIQIRNQEPALQTGSFEVVANSSNNILSFLRQSPNTDLLVLVNTAAAPISNVDLDLTLSDVADGNYVTTNLLSGHTKSATINNGVIENWNLAIPYEVQILKLEKVTSTTDLVASSQLKIYPNPAKSNLMVVLPNSSNVTTYYTILALDGSIVRQSTLNPNGEIEIDDLYNGIYMLRVEQAGKIVHSKFVKAK